MMKKIEEDEAEEAEDSQDEDIPSEEEKDNEEVIEATGMIEDEVALLSSTIEKVVVPVPVGNV
jgi:hypothetical protein